MTQEEFVAAFILITVASWFMRGWPLFRYGLFVFGWQLLTPSQPPEIDIPMFIVCALIYEYAYKQIIKRLKHASHH